MKAHRLMWSVAFALLTSLLLVSVADASIEHVQTVVNFNDAYTIYKLTYNHSLIDFTRDIRTLKISRITEARGHLNKLKIQWKDGNEWRDVWTCGVAHGRITDEDFKARTEDIMRMIERIEEDGYLLIKVSGEFKGEFKDDGYYIKIDHIPMFKGHEYSHYTWWDASWTRRKAITINNVGGGELTDYQLFLNISYDSDMKSDFGDIRVVNETAQEAVPYWIEDFSEGEWCRVWFKASYIPANSILNNTYYLYYSNSEAVNESNGTAVFDFFDNFNENDKWTDVGDASHSISNNQMTVDIGNGYSMVYRNEVFTIGKALHFTLVSRSTNYAAVHLPHATGNGDTERAGYIFFVNAGKYIKIYKYIGDEIAWQEYGTDASCPTPSDWEIRWWQDGSYAKLEFIIDGVSRVSKTDTSSIHESGYIGFWNDYDRDIVVSNVRLRKYTSPEPTASLGEEEVYTPAAAPTASTENIILALIFMLLSVIIGFFMPIFFIPALIASLYIVFGIGTNDALVRLTCGLFGATILLIFSLRVGGT